MVLDKSFHPSKPQCPRLLNGESLSELSELSEHSGLNNSHY